MTTHQVTIAMNGVTGRMGATQHLERSIIAIRDQGGVPLSNGDTVWPDVVLVGRNAGKLRALVERHGIDRWSTDLDAVLADDSVDVYFDAQRTSLRADGVRRALDAGKAVYCEKPRAEDAATAIDLVDHAARAGAATGIVQDKLYLPGLRKLRRLLDLGFFGRILSVRCEFGYWVFPGDVEPTQRPSWNYRAEDGGGIVLDMYPHWQYVVEGLFGRIRSVCCHATTHVPERVDETGRRYAATADDAAYGLLELSDGVVVQINSSWATRVYRDELVVFHVDGTHGSAVAGLRDCRVQPAGAAPRPVWNPDVPSPIDFRSGWLDIPDLDTDDNAFKLQWEDFLRAVVTGEPYPHDLRAGARGLQLVDAALRSSRERRWIDMPEWDR
ncbi:MAG TPA: Gfo/Idh/MocA family oxidoreductase [Euzebyales bacterium]|nr:Gfo/Idh/MocA family oxidoreductase [Euzebyales bacterium]